MVKKILTHINKNKSPKMVDIIDKKISKRLAVAEGIIKFKKETFYKISKLRTLKGEVKNIAILSGIVGAIKTSELIPLCHNIPINVNGAKWRISNGNVHFTYRSNASD